MQEGGQTRTTTTAARRARMALAMGMLVVAAVALVASSTEEPSLVEGGTTTTGARGQPADDFAIGDLIELGDFRLIVYDFTDPYPDNSATTSPSDDDRWVAVDAEVTNLDDEAVTMSATTEFEIQDSIHRGYNVIDTGESLPELSGEIPAGGSRRGTLVFEVSGASTGLRLSFAGDVFASGSAQVALG
jgi:hypothetical protein